ncbi:hypothetical protein BOVMAS05_18900 [Streptococcus uberis]
MQLRKEFRVSIEEHNVAEKKKLLRRMSRILFCNFVSKYDFTPFEIDWMIWQLYVIFSFVIIALHVFLNPALEKAFHFALDGS